MTDAVIFDLGNTLVAYYTRAEWPAVLAEAIGETAAHLRRRGRLREVPADLAARIQAENRERRDHRVVPLEDRLARIFALGAADLAGDGALRMCRRFLGPIFARGRRYADALPALEVLRQRGLRTGILSNLPWGSPTEPWREELARQELLGAVDAVVLCRDVGYRKPAPQPFEAILARLGARAEACLFVGDDPRWDTAGAAAVGMPAVLIDRDLGAPLRDGCMRSLSDLAAKI